MNLGIAFQLVDDALDYAADQATLGKTVGDDFREGKITLPVLLAFAHRGTDERDSGAAPRGREQATPICPGPRADGRQTQPWTTPRASPPALRR